MLIFLDSLYKSCMGLVAIRYHNPEQAFTGVHVRAAIVHNVSFLLIY